MSKPILILGESGSGKSYSIRNLPGEQTFLINVIGKDLPFRGSKKKYTLCAKETPNGNMVSCDDYDKIAGLLDGINTRRKEIKYVVIDDSQYLLVNEFMRKHNTEGKGNQVFQLYNDIGDHFWNLIWKARLYREDLMIFFLHHTEETDQGKVKAKTIGKMLDEKVDIPGMFTIVIICKTEGENHFFETSNKGMTPAKSPPGMFESDRIDNDLLVVANAIAAYEKGE